ncbi:MAG TPA: hypothetical protein VIY47_03960 [Ignavibacteriaceae bacterium]
MKSALSLLQKHLNNLKDKGVYFETTITDSKISSEVEKFIKTENSSKAKVTTSSGYKTKFNNNHCIEVLNDRLIIHLKASVILITQRAIVLIRNHNKDKKMIRKRRDDRREPSKRTRKLSFRRKRKNFAIEISVKTGVLSNRI